MARDVEEFLQGQVRGGVCADAGELVNDVVRAVRDPQWKLFTVTPELAAWLLRSADQSVTPLKQRDFDGIRDPVRRRMPPSAP